METPEEQPKVEKVKVPRYDWEREEECPPEPEPEDEEEWLAAA